MSKIGKLAVDKIPRCTSGVEGNPVAARQPDMQTEFDGYAADYSELLKDPLREMFASGPEFFHRQKWLLLREIIEDSGRDPATLSWLDIGCGRGELLRLVEARFRSAMGCDLSEGMLEDSVGLTVRRQTSPARLPYEDSSVDFVTAVCLYHHVSGEERTPLTRDVFRVLRPGGMCCVFEHNPLNPCTQLIVLRCPVDAQAKLLTAGRVRRLMRDSGFRVEGTFYYLFLPESLFLRIGRAERWLRSVPFGGQYVVVGRKRR